MIGNGTLKKAATVAILGLGVGAYSFLFASWDDCDSSTQQAAINGNN
jgi:hypothetical protein